MNKTCKILSLILILCLVSGFMGCLDNGGVTADPDVEINISYVEIREYDKNNYRAAHGHIFLYIQVHLRNLDDRSDLYPASRDFEVDTDLGYTHNYHDVIGFPNKIEPGGEDEFWISFEIREEDTGKILRYEPDWIQRDPFEEEIPSYR